MDTSTLSTKSLVLTIFNSLMGAGLLGMPLTYYHMGLLGSIFFSVLCGILSVATIYFLATVGQIMSKETSTISYNSVAKRTMPKIPWLVDVIVLIKCFGVSIGYLILAGNTLSSVSNSLSNESTPLWLIDRSFWIGMVVVFICVPLCLPEKLSALKHSSIVAMISTLYLLALVLCYSGFFFADGHTPSVSLKPHSVSGLIQYLSVFVFSYSCHQNILQLYQEYGCGHPMRITKAAIAAISLACVIYSLIGVFGSMITGSHVSKMVLESFGNATTMIYQSIHSRDPQSVSLIISQLMITLLVLTCFPLQIHTARNSALALFLMLFNGDRKVRTIERWICAGVLCAMSAVAALLVTDFVSIVKIVGAFGTAPIVLILPSLFYVLIGGEINWMSVSVIVASFATWITLIAALFIQ